ncbi:MAG: DUF4007 family protein [Verrucomicrobia bacterium]|nr:DUF4007 family protein [Verrucomicrobiota bacterium]
MNYRYSGHETFPCRYTWLPKAVRSLRENPQLFSDEDKAMVGLGVGKNMVRAIRFWADAGEVAVPDSTNSGLAVSDFGNLILGPKGRDEFLEDIRCSSCRSRRSGSGLNQSRGIQVALSSIRSRRQFSS